MWGCQLAQTAVWRRSRFGFAHGMAAVLSVKLAGNAAEEVRTLWSVGDAATVSKHFEKDSVMHGLCLMLVHVVI